MRRQHLAIAFTLAFMAPATIAIGAEAAFVDSFENGLTAWDVLDPATWTAANGAVEITERQSAYQPPHRSPGHIALVKGFTMADGAIEFRVRSTLDTGAHRDCCVFFGWQDASHFYYVHFGAKPDPHSGQIMIVNDAPRRALTENTKPVPWDDDWHTIRLERDTKTGRIAAYFDGELLMEATDKTFGDGRVGIGSFDDLNAFDAFSATPSE